MTGYRMASRCTRCGSDDRVLGLQFETVDADGLTFWRLSMCVCLDCRRDLSDWAARRPADATPGREIPINHNNDTSHGEVQQAD